jgi:CubicO group peptidase (beta-lactamase class C family)
MAPNEHFKYSNVGYGLLGLVIEAASGRSYHDYVREEIVEGLGLRRTGPELGQRRLGEYAVGYTALTYADQRWPIDNLDTAAMAAATGFYSTADDLCRSAAGHFRSDRRLLSEASQRVMQHEWWPVEGLPDNSYGLGFSIIKSGDRRLLGHGGGFPGHITRTVFDPFERLAVAVLTNAIDGPAEELALTAVKLVDKAASHGDEDPAPARFCCRLANLWGVRDVARLGGRLYLLNPALPDPTQVCAELTVVDNDALRVTEDAGYGANGEIMRFQFGPDGTVQSVRGPGGMTWWPIDEFQLPTGPVSIPPDDRRA